jgi:hypothetical protein
MAESYLDKAADSGRSRGGLSVKFEWRQQTFSRFVIWVLPGSLRRNPTGVPVALTALGGHQLCRPAVELLRRRPGARFTTPVLPAGFCRYFCT